MQAHLETPGVHCSVQKGEQLVTSSSCRRSWSPSPTGSSTDSTPFHNAGRGHPELRARSQERTRRQFPSPRQATPASLLASSLVAEFASKHLLLASTISTSSTFSTRLRSWVLFDGGPITAVHSLQTSSPEVGEALPYEMMHGKHRRWLLAISFPLLNVTMRSPQQESERRITNHCAACNKNSKEGSQSHFAIRHASARRAENQIDSCGCLRNERIWQICTKSLEVAK